MEQILINLVTGALGGVAVGKSSPTFDLGMIGNIISGLVGGGVLGQVVTLLLPAITAAAESGNLSVIVNDTDDEATVKAKQEKVVAEHVARHPEDAGRTVKDFF